MIFSDILGMLDAFACIFWFIDFSQCHLIFFLFSSTIKKRTKKYCTSGRLPLRLTPTRASEVKRAIRFRDCVRQSSVASKNFLLARSLSGQAWALWGTNSFGEHPVWRKRNEQRSTAAARRERGNAGGIRLRNAEQSGWVVGVKSFSPRQ